MLTFPNQLLTHVLHVESLFGDLLIQARVEIGEDFHVPGLLGGVPDVDQIALRQVAAAEAERGNLIGKGSLSRTERGRGNPVGIVIFNDAVQILPGGAVCRDGCVRTLLFQIGR